MQFSKNALLIVMLCYGGVNSALAALTCTLNQSYGGASASGTITVSTIGTVAAANFTAWNVVVTVNSSTGSLTQSNSTLDLGSAPPTITSTANSLTITPVPMASLGTSGTSNFWMYTGGYAVQYNLMNDASMAPPTSMEAFIPVGTSSPDQVYNTSPPASLVLSCTCVTDSNVTCPSTPTSAPIDFSFNHKQPQTYSEEIIIK
jgi:hypothetical protein